MNIPLFKMCSDESDIEAVAKVIHRGTYWAIGPEIEEFEQRIAKFIGRKYALTFNSGTSALHTLLLAHDIKGKEGIVPSFTFIATANAVILAGGKPVFAESEQDTFGLDANDVESRITKKTVAIMPIHYGGFPARDTEKLRDVTRKHNLLFLEDAAQSLGARINGKMVGTFGESAIFSFCQNKVLTTGEGGLLVTDSQLIYEKAKLLRSHGRVELAEDYFSSIKDNDYTQAGYNFRMPTMCAALGLAQLGKVGKIIDIRRKKGHYLTKQLSKIKQIEVPKELTGHFQVYQMYTIKLPTQSLRDGLQEYLSSKGVMSKVYFTPVHLKTIYTKQYGYKEGDLPNTEKLSLKVLNIPLYPNITKEEMDYMIRHIKKFLEKST